MCDGALAQTTQRGCGISSLEIFRSRLDMVLGSLLWVALLEQELDQVDPDSPASLSHPVIL